MAARSRKSAATADSPEAAAAAGVARAAYAERAAACEMDLIQLFLAQKKSEIARRRLQKLCEEFAETDAATDASRLLQSL